jgi:hypothetical protein
MSGFSSAWLQLREAADHRSRSTFADQLDAIDKRHWSVIDLGAGTGSNLRFVAPVLRGRQEWICFDNDSALIKVLSHSIAPGESMSVAPILADIAEDPATLLANSVAQLSADSTLLVTASALLDLVSPSWIDAITHSCTRLKAIALFALTYDGRIELAPQHREDMQLIAAVNTHQRGDKGFGPALGPAATDYVSNAFRHSGYEIYSQRSDWELNGADAQLLQDLLTGWLEAAREATGKRNDFSEWFACRSAQMRAGELSVRVGHHDLLALPKDA